MNPAPDSSRRVLLAIFGVQVAGLVWIGIRNAAILTPDAAAYLRIASYYAEWNSQLMVSGYFSPMISWLLALLMKIGLDDLVAARLIMGFSAVFFLGSTWFFLGRLGVEKSHREIISLCTAVATIHWSVLGGVTPDLLTAAFLLLAMGVLFHHSWIYRPSRQLLGGALFGVAYLAKALALPFAILLIPASALLKSIASKVEFRRAAVAAGISLAALLIISGPWIGVLSSKYGFTISRAGPINHAIMGPVTWEQGYYHPPTRTYNVPEPGRLMTWEDPPDSMYVFWSPFDSYRLAKHQVLRLAWSARNIPRALWNFDRVGLSLLAILYFIVGAFLVGRREKNFNWLRRSPFVWQALLAIGCMTALYLPVYSGDLRYYYTLYPMLLLLALTMVDKVSESRGASSNRWRWIGRTLVIASCLFSAVEQNVREGNVHERFERLAVCAELMQEKIETGPVAGAGRNDALFIAYLTGQRFHGTLADPAREDILGSEATWIVEPEGSAFVAAVEAADDVRSAYGVEPLADSSFFHPEYGVVCRIFRVLDAGD